MNPELWAQILQGLGGVSPDKVPAADPVSHLQSLIKNAAGKDVTAAAPVSAHPNDRPFFDVLGDAAASLAHNTVVPTTEDMAKHGQFAPGAMLEPMYRGFRGATDPAYHLMAKIANSLKDGTTLGPDNFGYDEMGNATRIGEADTPNEGSTLLGDAAGTAALVAPEMVAARGAAPVARAVEEAAPIARDADFVDALAKARATGVVGDASLSGEAALKATGGMSDRVMSEAQFKRQFFNAPERRAAPRAEPTPNWMPQGDEKIVSAGHYDNRTGDINPEKYHGEDFYGADSRRYDELTENGDITQGFVTSKGRFLDRDEATKFAKHTNQVKEGATNVDTNGLHSSTLKPPEEDFYAKLDRVNAAMAPMNRKVAGVRDAFVDEGLNTRAAAALERNRIRAPEPSLEPESRIITAENAGKGTRSAYIPQDVLDISSGDARIPKKFAGRGVRAAAQESRVRGAADFLESHPPLQLNPMELKYLDEAGIKPDAGPTQAPLPERAGFGSKQRAGHLTDVDTPENRRLAEAMARRGAPVGETWYPSYKAVSNFMEKWGGDPEMFRKATSASSVRNTVPAELHGGSAMYGALKSGVISADELAAARAMGGAKGVKAFGKIAAKVREWARTVTPGGGAPALMGGHVDMFEHFVNGGEFDSHKVPMFAAHKGGDVPGMVIDSHAVRQHSFGSRFGPLYKDTPNKQGEYGFFESLMRRNAQGLGMSDRGYQASTWTGGGLLSGLQTDPTMNFAQLFERQLVDNAKRRGISVEKLSEDLAAGKTVLKDLSREGKAKVKRISSVVPDMPKADPLAGTGIPSGEELAQKGLMSRPRVVPGADAARPTKPVVHANTDPHESYFYSLDAQRGDESGVTRGVIRQQALVLPSGKRVDFHTTFFPENKGPREIRNSVLIDWAGNADLQRGKSFRHFSGKDIAAKGMSREDMKSLRDHILEEHPYATHAIWERLTTTPAKDGRFVKVNLRTGKMRYIPNPDMVPYINR